MNPQRPVRTRSLPEGYTPAIFGAIDPVLARVYAARGVAAAEELDYSLPRLAPVGSLEAVDSAVNLLLANRGKGIVVVGDFDVDGATSTALFLRCLADFGFAEVSHLVPNRFRYGYGLSSEIVAVAADRRPGLIVTVDNGISSLDGVDAARAAGIAVLITDHHLPAGRLPAADVIVNPNLRGSRFASRNLAGVGVAFYVLAALGRALAQAGQLDAGRVPARYLDLVALGTVADVVPLDGNNRILVEQGLRRIRAGQSLPGIDALLRVSGRDPRRATSADLGFAAGPRLNAAGRLEDMSIGIECLLSKDAGVAARHAATLDAINRDRRDIEASMREQAYARVARLAPGRLPSCICVYDESWHQGVVGLIAARVKERWHRPVIAFARDSDGRLKGSVRSVHGVHARDLLESVSSARPGLIDKFGGHAMAAGLTIEESAYSAFAELAARQLEVLYPAADFSGTLITDGTLPGNLQTLAFARTLRHAGPWGAGFPEPLFCGDFEVLELRTVGEQHLRMKVRSLDGGAPIDAIAFNQAESTPRGRLRLVYRLDVNEYRGIESPQLIIEQLSALAAA